ncbi:hypothetical protein GH714_038554 [Hevea brasiliensis]|uniref:PGG domain-containing protein n=1 Tax=Hevea brasiliensis TaxID=3981 RepID=A0A6A6N9Y7_HEVBR|nr:hypothetical protein GH714_038554 [Hevea brasiliensis]
MDKRWAEAAREGNIPELYNLIQEDTDVLENIDRKAFVDTPLHIAALQGHIEFAMEVLKMLLRCRARTDIEDLAGLTAMEILRDQVRLTERQIWNMQAAGAGFLFPFNIFYKRVISLAHSVRQEAQTPRSRPLEWKLWRRRKWKSSEKRNIELVVDTLVATAVFQASLSPPGGLWQGTANADINSPMRVNNSSTTSAATSTHFTVYFVKYISVPSEPRVKPRRRRVKIRDRKEWW